MPSRKPNDPPNPSPPAGGEGDPPYRVYRSGRADRADSPDTSLGSRATFDPTTPEPERPYTTYRSTPRGLRNRLRDPDAVDYAEPRGLDPSSPRRRRSWRRGPITPWRVVRWAVGIVVVWLLLSVVLFFVSAGRHRGALPAGAKSQLSGSGPMLTSANTVLVLGLDNRPTTGAGSKEGGLTASQFSEKDANTDTIMLWRIGGGVSRRLSIPRDTLVDIPGLGESKINAAWSYGGPGLALKVIKQFTGLTINHVIVVDLANFPKFIDDIGGVNVRTGRICSNISGGTADGGFTLRLTAGSHHLDGEQALILARTRENSCDRYTEDHYDDLNREQAQQRIVNSIKSQLLTVHTFLHLPWAAWDAPGVVQTDMGGLSLLQLFVASEIGGSPPSGILKETASTYDGADVLMPNSANLHTAVRKLITGR